MSAAGGDPANAVLACLALALAFGRGAFRVTLSGVRLPTTEYGTSDSGFVLIAL